MLVLILLGMINMAEVTDGYTCNCYCPTSYNYAGIAMVSSGTCSTSSCIAACIISGPDVCESTWNTFA